MVHAMAKDRGTLPRVACLFAVIALFGALFGALFACGPRVQPDHPFPDEPVVHRERAPAPARPGRQVVVGELCPQGAGGRPAVAPLLIRTTQWLDATTEGGGAGGGGAPPPLGALGGARA